MLIAIIFVGCLLNRIVSQWDKATGTDFSIKLQESARSLKELTDARDGERKAMAVENEIRGNMMNAKDELNREKLQKALEAKVSESNARRLDVEKLQKQASEEAIKAIALIHQGGPSEKVVLYMVSLLDALGASLHLIGSLVMYIGNGQLKRRWLLYYLSLPVVGAALAPNVYMLLRVGILTPSGATNGGSGTANLNLIGVYAFAALSGMFAKTATDKLTEVFDTIFRTGKRTGKDRIGSERAPGSNP